MLYVFRVVLKTQLKLRFNVKLGVVRHNDEPFDSFENNNIEIVFML